VVCLKTAIAALDAIVAEGEGAPRRSDDSHFEAFVGIREELHQLLERNPHFSPAFPAARNPVLRRPPHPEGKVWIEDETAASIVDVGNACYGVMLRLLAYTYAVPSPSPEKALAVDLGIGIMRAVTLLGERAARLPAGARYPACNAGMSFTTLRDAAPLPTGAAARRFFRERLTELASAADELRSMDRDERIEKAARVLMGLSARARTDFAKLDAAQTSTTGGGATPTLSALPLATDGISEPAPSSGVETAEGEHIAIDFEAKRCIHARFCVTGAPKVFLANVTGPWIHPDRMDTAELVEVARACPSGAIQYRPKDGRPSEHAPPVNLVSVREAGPYAVRADMRLNGRAIGFRATLCRCGASKNKPFCDGSHHDAGFLATGEPPTGSTATLETRDGRVSIDPQTDGPLLFRGNIEIISGTGRIVSRTRTARLCRCGASNNKPFCDNSHQRVGFKSDV
jgi:CDGSH-type Zn-finger protein/uncharacterized Fe-S cluster protein YjdI